MNPLVYIDRSLADPSPAKGKGYIGRFAPSPSGPLHFGSLVAAVGSYLQARSQEGQWLLRIEDIDPPREVAGAAQDILRCLQAHQLFWDGPVVYQSQRSALYEQCLGWLYQQGFSYYCQCSRAQLASLITGQCCVCSQQQITAEHCATRFKNFTAMTNFTDGLFGQVKVSGDALNTQFTLKRSDGLYAYQLAVVVDDIQQGITEVARGADLLQTSPNQIALYAAFGHPAPDFLHFPVVVTAAGKKLSKQNHAKALDITQVKQNLISALGFLGLEVPLGMSKQSAEHIMSWAVDLWHISKVPKLTECIDNRIGVSERL
jgi:glutamyl-Q tRNA(Asp) synthetase